MARREPAFTRLGPEERRRRLLALGRALFTSSAYDELSMAAIARQAGISKALLYHYFPSKQAFFVATLDDAAAELAAQVRPDRGLPPRDQLSHALGVWLAWLDGHRAAYARLMRSATAVAEVRVLIDGVRDGAASEVLTGLLGDEPAPPELRAAVHGWLWFADGACRHWAGQPDLPRERLEALLHGTLPGAIAAAGHPALAARLTQ